MFAPNQTLNQPQIRLQTDYRKSTAYAKLATEYKESCTVKIDLSNEYHGKRSEYKGGSSEYNGLDTEYNVESTEYFG